MIRRTGRERGSALTELALCLLPYGLLFLGVTLLFQLGLGLQEASKSVAWYAATPPGTGPSDVLERFFIRDTGQATIAQKRIDDPADPAGMLEEPVLPFGNTIPDSGNRLDLEVALQRSLSYTADTGGTIHVHDERGVALKLRDIGVVSASSFDQSVNVSQSLDFNDPGKLDIGELELTAVGRDVLLEAAALLGDGRTDGRWLVYHGVEVENYQGGLSRVSWGRGGPLPMESEEGADVFRRDITLSGSGTSASPTPLTWLEMVMRNTDADRGTHHPGGEPNVLIQWIPRFVTTEKNDIWESPQNNTDTAATRYGDKTRGLLGGS